MRVQSIPKSPAPGVEYRKLNSRGVVAHTARVDLRQAKVRILLPSRARQIKTLRDLTAVEPKVLVGINASYFTTEGDVVGLLVKDGVQIKTIPEERFKIDLTQLGFKQASATISNDDHLEGYAEVVSGGPCLIRDRLIMDFEGRNGFLNHKDRRTAVGLISQSEIVCVVAENATGYELAQILLQLGVTDAINLDGGSSSSMIIRGPDGMEVVTGSNPVAAGLAFCER